MSESLVAVDLPRQRRWSSKVRTGCQTCRYVPRAHRVFDVTVVQAFTNLVMYCFPCK